MPVKRVKNSSVANRINIALRDMENKNLKVGWVRGKYYADVTYPDGKKRPSDMTTAQVAYEAEHGVPSRNQPPRPIIRPTMIQEQNTWARIALNESKKVIRGQVSASGALDRFGAVASGDIRKTISRLQSPPLAEATKRARAIRKGNLRKTEAARDRQIKQRMNNTTFVKPLVETKTFLNSCTWAVENGE